jgi:glycerol-3-phosphate O-acyltransferase
MKDLFFEKLLEYQELGYIEKKYADILKEFYLSYKIEVGGSNLEDLATKIFLNLLEFIKLDKEKPYKFKPYHQKIVEPINYYLMGLNFIRPLVEKNSSLLGVENLVEIERILNRKENVILFSNHQTESDPQIISVLLDEKFKELAMKIIYIAGERVITDPLAIPFSKGCDLLCIYSKKYIDNPLELKREKQLHNKKTMELLSSLLSEGGKIIYVAPSGGRDRAKNGKIEVAPFDPSSIEMLHLTAQRSSKKTHFFPLALLTYHLLPPPDDTQIEMGERRKTKKANVFAYFGKEITMDNLPISSEDKLMRRQQKAEYIQKFVENLYEKLRSL